MQMPHDPPAFLAFLTDHHMQQNHFDKSKSSQLMYEVFILSSELNNGRQKTTAQNTVCINTDL